MNRNPANMANISADILIEIAFSGDAQSSEDVRKNIRKWIEAYTKDSELGAILFNTNFHISYISSKVWDTPWLRLDGTMPVYEDFDERDWTRDYLKAHIMEIEPYEIAIEETKKCGAEAWFSIRMNEFHWINLWEFSSACLWCERVDLRIGEDKPFDYEKDEVREYYLNYIKELSENYDIDGIELDFWRGEYYFRSPITPEKTEILTNFIKEIRLTLDEIGKRKGKRIKLSARTSVHPKIAEENGWDSAKWVANGSIDILTLSNFFVPTTYEAEVEKWCQLISRKGVSRDKYKINVGTEGSVFCTIYNREETRWKIMDTEALKGFAATHIDRGADGVYTFSIPNRDYEQPLEKRKVNFPVAMSKTEIYKGRRSHVLSYDIPISGGYKKHLITKIKPDKDAEFELHTSKVPEMGTYTIIVGTNQKKPNIEVWVNGKKCSYTGKLEGALFEEDGQRMVDETSQAAKYVGKYELENLKYALDGINNITIKSKDEQTIEVTWLEVLVDNQA